MKAKRKIDALNVRLGAGVQNGESNVKTRLEKLEALLPNRIANLVSDIEKTTAINLNKHNIRLNLYSASSRYKLKEMIVDDFKDTTGLDMTASVNVTHDAAAHKIKMTDPSQEATAYTVTERLDTIPIVFFLSDSSNKRSSADLPVDLTKGTFNKIASYGGQLQLALVQANVYEESGAWESEVIDLGEDAKEILLKSVTSQNIGTMAIYTASSEDGEVFSEFAPVNVDTTIGSAIKRYVKVKVEMTGEHGSVQIVLNPVTEYNNKEIKNLPAGYEMMAGQYVQTLKKYNGISTVPADGYDSEQIVKAAKDWSMTVKGALALNITIKRYTRIETVIPADYKAEEIIPVNGSFSFNVVGGYQLPVLIKRFEGKNFMVAEYSEEELNYVNHHLPDMKNVNGPKYMLDQSGHFRFMNEIFIKRFDQEDTVQDTTFDNDEIIYSANTVKPQHMLNIHGAFLPRVPYIKHFVAAKIRLTRDFNTNDMISITHTGPKMILNTKGRFQPRVPYIKRFGYMLRSPEYDQSTITHARQKQFMLRLKKREA
jgi:hypothetical protein